MAFIWNYTGLICLNAVSDMNTLNFLDGPWVSVNSLSMYAFHFYQSLSSWLCNYCLFSPWMLCRNMLVDVNSTSINWNWWHVTVMFQMACTTHSNLPEQRPFLTTWTWSVGVYATLHSWGLAVKMIPGTHARQFLKHSEKYMFKKIE